MIGNQTQPGKACRLPWRRSLALATLGLASVSWPAWGQAPGQSYPYGNHPANQPVANRGIIPVAPQQGVNPAGNGAPNQFPPVNSFPAGANNQGYAVQPVQYANQAAPYNGQGGSYQGQPAQYGPQPQYAPQPQYGPQAQYQGQPAQYAAQAQYNGQPNAYPVQPAQATFPPGSFSGQGFNGAPQQGIAPQYTGGPAMPPPGMFMPAPVPSVGNPAMVSQAPAPVTSQPYSGGPVSGPVAPVESTPVRDFAPTSVQAKVDHYIADVIEPEVRLNVKLTKGTLIRTKHPIERMSITDPGVVDTIQYHPNEFELVGRALGETTLTLWFPDAAVQAGKKPYIRYLIRCVPNDPRSDEGPDAEFGKLQRRINELFPNSHIQLIPVLDKLIVRGQARDGREASQIMAVLADQAVDQTGATIGPGGWGGVGGWGRGGGFGGVGGVSRFAGSAAGYGAYGANGYGAGVGRNNNSLGLTGMPTSDVISMLEVPGEQQVMLKVRVAELTRTALRQMGANFTGRAGDFTFASVLNVQGAASAVLTSSQVDFVISALSSNRTSKVLAEPNLVTLNGYPASFIAGGQFAVPTVVGLGGAAAATTGFQGYGTQVFFTPTVLDKDHIRLRVAPTVSRLDSSTSVNGIFGLNTRSVATTVDLREGQWLAIAGLIQDSQTGEKARVPWLGDIPVVDIFFSRKTVTREETEIVILVSPELVHPMEPDQVPQILPGMEVTDPDDAAFFLRGRYEGNPALQHRSTVWPVYRNDVYDARNRAIRDSKGSRGYLNTERYYMKGPYGFCN